MKSAVLKACTFALTPFFGLRIVLLRERKNRQPAASKKKSFVYTPAKFLQLLLFFAFTFYALSRASLFSFWFLFRFLGQGLEKRFIHGGGSATSDYEGLFCPTSPRVCQRRIRRVEKLPSLQH